MEQGKLVISTKLDTKSFDKQIEYVEKQLQTLEKSADESKIPEAFRRSEEEARKLNQEIEKTRNKLNDLKRKKNELDNKKSNDFKKWLKDAGNEANNTVKKLSRMALGIFAIRSAFNFVRSSVSTLSSNNEQLAADIENIRYGLASGLLPIIQTIISWVYKLMQYVNLITQAWFGFTMFTDKPTDNLKKANKQAKELKRTLAGFDEMNVLSSNKSDEDDSGVGASQSFNIDKEKKPGWLGWIKKNKDIVIAGLMGIAAGLLAVKLGLGLIKGLGIGLIVAGVVLLIQGIMDFLEDPSWRNFLTILEGIALIVAGIAILMGGWIVALVALGVAIVAYVIQNWDKVKEILGAVGSWINEHIIKPIVDFFVGMWESIKQGFSNAINDFKTMLSTLWDAFKWGIGKIGSIFVDLWNGIKEGAGAAFNGLKSIFGGIVSFFSGIINKILGFFGKLGASVGNVIGSAFKAVVNGVLWAIENILNTPIRTINGLIGIINKVPGINITKLSTFKLPRLAKGGIINMPGRGIPIGGAIGGEAGSEGVIPLTDSQQMALLGEAIGRYITVNLTNVTSLDGRTIARQMNTINANKQFATNR